MEKTILIEIDDNGTITISQDQKKEMILSDNREISADKIYSLLSYERGDTYKLEKKNPNDKDSGCVDEFALLIKDITDELNKYSASLAAASQEEEKAKNSDSNLETEG